MLLALKKIEELVVFLEQEVSSAKISDFKVFLKPNLEINIIVVSETSNYSSDRLSHQSIKTEVISEDEKRHDPYYTQLFNESGKVELGFKRRFASFSNKQPLSKDISNIPVVTFYSYKGGMGRSTTLVAYAMFCAMHEKKKVVILDCDFEAPGYLNFFNLSNNPRLLNGEVNGIVEYFLDNSFEGEKINLVDNYTVLVDKDYSGEGEIRIMPAGNLNEDRIITDLKDFEGNSISTHKDHYIETLSRLDTSRNESIVSHFQKLINKIETDIKPDLILIDSRTGFNDIFGVTALYFSNCIIGFFGSSEQTKPGLKFLLDRYNKIKKNDENREINLILVNSILPKESSQSHFNLFRRDVENYLIGKREDTLPDSYFISRNPILENIGISLEENVKFEKNFIDYIKNIINNDDAKEHLELFKGITFKISPQKEYNFNTADFAKNKLEILKNLETLLGKEDGKVRLFAEYEPITEELFFYRECMNEIISRPEKFIISGFKGTGKTYLYKAFKNETIKNELIRRAKQESQNFVFIDIIEISRDDNSFEYTKKYNFNQLRLSEINDKRFYFERLWLIYSWNSIMIESKKTFGFESSIPELVLPINKFGETKLRFDKIINDDSIFVSIENDLRRLNNYLNDKNINLIILFDQLDKDIHPDSWREIVSPLVKYWESNPFKRIVPKIFVRTDLFGRLELNNSLNLKKNNLVSIEWEREELYSYFFKLILAKSKEQLFKILQDSTNFDESIKLEIIKSSQIYNQIPLKRHLLEPLVTLTFGKEVIKTNKWVASKNYKGNNQQRETNLGNSYEYFFFNFKNANDTISIRPFINLMSYVSTDSLSKQNLDLYKNTLPLISSSIYLKNEFRDLAVEEHFSDLTNEGNLELKYIVQYLRENTQYKFQYLTSIELQEFLNGVIENYKSELNGKSREELQELLEANGIIAEQIKPDGRIYFFAMLFKFWLGLKSRKYQYGKVQRNLYSGSDFEKIEAHFKNKLKIEGIYQQSLLGTMIFEATKRNWSQVFEYSDYDSFLEALQQNGIIELKEQNKFKLIKTINLKTINEL
jgi:cellulose biosynthesis protein BcsQ